MGPGQRPTRFISRRLSLTAFAPANERTDTKSRASATTGAETTLRGEAYPRGGWKIDEQIAWGSEFESTATSDASPAGCTAAEDKIASDGGGSLGDTGAGGAMGSGAREQLAP
jgi:hypothetical protein